MSVIASSGVDGNDEELILSQKLWDKVREKGFDHVGDATDSDEVDDSEPSESEESDLPEDSDESVDSRQAHIEAMADEMENQINA
jgi:hypothetical protein